MKGAIVCFCKVSCENGKNLLPEIFLSYQKRISSIDVSIVLQRSVDDFRVCKGRKTAALPETQANQIF